MILRDAVRVLVSNWDGAHTVPSRRLYPHQWSWDSAFIAIGNARWSPRRARSELLALFGSQWRDGRVPHIAFNPKVPEGAYFPGDRKSTRQNSSHPQQSRMPSSA